MVEIRAGIDIGHGEDVFPFSKGIFKDNEPYEEHHFNSKLGVALRKELNNQGMKVVFAQLPFSKEVPLRERDDLYIDADVDFVVSLHANWSSSSSVNGTCAFYWNSSDEGKQLAGAIIKHVKDVGDETHGNGIHVSQYNSWTNLFITRALPMPSVLVENGFMSGSRDFNLIFGSEQMEFIAKRAKTLAQAICEYSGVEYKESNIVEKEPIKGEFYRVQVGAFKDLAGVAKFADEVEKRTHVNTYITEVNGWLKVQVGAFAKKENAEVRLKVVQSKGYTDAFITTESGKAVKEVEPYNDPIEKKDEIVVDGIWGKGTTRALQKELDSIVDGILSGQYRNSVTEEIYGVKYGKGGSLVVRKLQAKIGAKVDSYIGRETITRLQKYLGTYPDGIISKPSAMVKEMQHRLNAGTF